MNDFTQRRLDYLFRRLRVQRKRQAVADQELDPVKRAEQHAALRDEIATIEAKIDQALRRA